MQQFKKLGVFLHNSPSDDAALAYAGAIATRAHSESVLCIHVGESDDGAPSPAPADLETTVRQKLPPAVAGITQVKIHAGTGVPEILRAARDMSLDLIIVGRRLPSEQIGIGSAFARLARKAPCDVLVVPTHSHPHLERLFVPVDFSEHSRRALALAVEIARGSGAAQPQLVVHTNFTVGYGYAKLGLSLPQAVAQRDKTAQNQMQEFLGQVDTTGLQVERVCTSSEQIETAILEVAVARKMDLIVIGSRGKGRMFLLGSTTERLLLQAVLPVLVVKEKGETLSILDALFGAG